MSLSQSQYVVTQRGITALFKRGYMSASPFYPTVCTERMSGGKDEGYAHMGSVPGVREWVGERHFKQIGAAQWTLANKKFEVSVEIEKDDYEDDRLGGYSDLIMDIGSEMAFHPDELRLQTMCNGSSEECWDGQYFYDTDHVWRDSGTQSNIVTYNATDHTAVTTAEFKDAFQESVDRMLGFKKDNGKPWIRPIVGRLDNLLIEVPVSLRTAAYNAFGQQFALEGGAATTNVITDMPQIACAPQLGASGFGSDAEFYLHYIGGRIKPFIMQKRWANPTTSMKGWDDDEEKALKFMGTNRFNVGYLAPMYSIKVVFN